MDDMFLTEKHFTILMFNLIFQQKIYQYWGITFMSNILYSFCLKKFNLQGYYGTEKAWNLDLHFSRENSIKYMFYIGDLPPTQ